MLKKLAGFRTRQIGFRPAPRGTTASLVDIVCSRCTPKAPVSDGSHDREKPSTWAGSRQGVVERTEHDYADWERRIDAMAVLLWGLKGTKKLLSVDEHRRAIESLPPQAYDAMTYYEKWILRSPSASSRAGSSRARNSRARWPASTVRGVITTWAAFPQGRSLPEHDYAAWERRIDALVVCFREKNSNYRGRAAQRIESLPPDAYDKMSYYERWTAALAHDASARDDHHRGARAQDGRSSKQKVNAPRFKPGDRVKVLKAIRRAHPHSVLHSRLHRRDRAHLRRVLIPRSSRSCARGCPLSRSIESDSFKRCLARLFRGARATWLKWRSFNTGWIRHERPRQIPPLSYFQLMEISLRELLVEKGILTNAQVDAEVEDMRRRTPERREGGRAPGSTRNSRSGCWRMAPKRAKSSGSTSRR